jgi:uncharacterized repeat protein (TIGR02543 family)
MLPLPSGFSQDRITSIYFNATRTGSNITWNTMIDNIGIKIDDAAPAVPATDVTVEAQYETIDANGGSTTLAASVAPFDASDHTITWSVNNALATVTPNYPSWTATVKGANAGGGDATVTAESATGGILATKVIHLSTTGIPLTNVTVSGATSVAVNGTITLTKTVGPGNASNQNVIWSSDDDGIAMVNQSTGVVTGVGAGTVTITATAADGGGAFDTHDVTVTFTSVTKVDLQGARRIFYTSTAPFQLTSVVLPADASNPTLSWSSLDPSIATVSSSGQVTLTGDFGTTAIKAETTDGSGVTGYYYIEVAATNPYDGFSDFETSAAPFGGSTSSYQSSKMLYFNQEGQSGGRSATYTLTNKIEGGIINLRFDWYAGRVRSSFKDNPSLPEINSGTLSIQDEANNMILVFIFADTDIETDHISYIMGNYVSSTGSKPEGISLENVTNLDAWYTIDLTLDYLANTCTFTIKERDNPANSQTLTAIPLSEAFPPEANVKSLFINGLRTATNNLTMTSAIDNFAYKVIDATLPTYAVTGLSVDGLDQVAPGSKILIYPKILPGNALNKNVTWQSFNTGVATVTVDANGRAIITGESEGTTVIRATSDEDPLIYAEKTITVAPVTLPQRQMEQLDRGLVAVKSGSNVFLSWRLFNTDPSGVTFNIHKNGASTPLNGTPLDAAHTDFSDTGGSTGDTYEVAVLYDDIEVYRSAPATVWGQQYLSIPVQMPTTGHLPNGAPYTNYSIYDGSTADLDGDGQYEIVFLWAPANLQDNSNGGATGNVFIDAYKLDGTKLWGSGKYIDLGSNIRAGAHYSPFLVFDFDGNGKAEIIVKTADGTTDTQGTQIGTNTIYANADGFVLDGPEYLSVFEGATGRLLASAPYEPPRGNVVAWGDRTGNRADRFLAAVAYLDGVHPSAVMCRGYYTRTTLCAYDWNGTSLIKRWLFDTNLDGAQYRGQGNHNMSVGDVDQDGKDEIIYGSLTIDDNGHAMYTTGLGHGDAMHVGKLDPNRPGLQMMGVHESPFPYGMEMHDLLTGDLIWSVKASGDIGRGVAADIDPAFDGVESWSSGGLGTWSAQGTKISGSSPSSMNMAVYWDGDTGRELFDGGSNPSVTKPIVTGSAPNKTFGNNSLIQFSGASTNGGTKNNPCLQADILGDWREEMILRATDNSELRIYTTITPTAHAGAGAVPASGIPTLMHNKGYRLAVAWQNSGYNQPPHADVFIGYNMDNVDRPADGAGFTVTLNPDGGKFSDDQTQAPRNINTVTGTHITLPEVTKDGGFYSIGWMFADGTLYDPTAIYKEDLLLKVLWNLYKVTFTDQGVETQQLVPYGTKASQPATTAREGYTFDGWYNGNTLWNFNNPVTDDITLTAKWSLNLYHVAFVSENATISSQNVYHGQTANEPAAPEREGHTFEGWYRGNSLWNFNNPVTENVTLTAKWSLNLYRVTFVSENVKIGYQDVYYGQKATPPVEPVRVGYTFEGWLYIFTMWDFNNDIVKNNIILTAVWNESTGSEVIGSTGILLYPNPVSDLLTISGLEGGEQISFIDPDGHVSFIYRAESGKVSIPVSNLSNGIYFVRITKDYSLIKTMKVIVSK